MRSALFLAVSVVIVASPARAQRTLAHDTLSESTPTAVTCGFCATEQFGVVFRELPSPLRGLDPGDFPLELRTVQIALASARIVGAAPAYTCEGDLAGGTALAEVTIWAGTTPPTGSIRALPRDDAWSADETLVWAGIDVPLELSVPDTDGSTMFELQLNAIMLADEMGAPIVIAPPATYVRVAVVIPAGGSSTACDAASLEPPAGVPIRDDDGVITAERSFLYADGYGFAWNESSPAGAIGGDWAIRLQLVPATPGPRDGGAGDDAGPEPDAASADAGALDGGSAIDAGSTHVGGGGCGCGVPSRAPRRGAAVLGLALALALGIASRRRRSVR